MLSEPTLNLTAQQPHCARLSGFLRGFAGPAAG